VRVISIIGARPQFVKAAAICWAVAGHTGGGTLDHRLIHTGQHYDAEMSDVFFTEMGIPAPHYNLEVGSGSHGVQTGEMMKRLEPVLAEEKPDWVLLYGDTNSTLAGAAVAAKLHFRVAHIEAGLRSFNRRMPEEINRIVADHLSDLLLCPTATAIRNLEKEGLAERAVMTGDVMYDAALKLRAEAERRGGQLAGRWKKGEFALATIHRAENTDEPARLMAIMSALECIAADICPVVLPLHPRTSKTLAAMGWAPRAIEVIRPVSYMEMLLLEGRARLVLTDSGGVQKEAYFAQVPCITLRDETEWVETLENGCNTLAGAVEEYILAAAKAAAGAGPWNNAYGRGDAGTAILNALDQYRAS
jgi:UDP-GlcNAc3NAcA epimerase